MWRAARVARITVAALLAAGCTQGPTEFLVHLADPKPYPGLGAGLSAHRLVVERVPRERSGWPMVVFGLRRLMGLERPDTVAGIRLLIPPVQIRDSLVRGVDVLNRPFTYDAGNRVLARSPTPPWLHDMALDLMIPAFSPSGEHLVYLAHTPDDEIEAVVRDWPDGLVRVRGPRGRRPADRLWQRGDAVWLDSTRFITSYNLWLAQDIVRVTVRARVGDSTIDADSASIVDSVAAVLAAEQRGAELAAQQSAEERAGWLAAREARFDSALRALPRLPPAAFPGVPAQFARELDSLGCMVPQSYLDSTPHNLIHGAFGAADQQDWAALCSRGGRSSIVLHWGGPGECPSELGVSDDRGYLLELDGPRVGFTRSIIATDHYREYDEERGEAVDVRLPHQAIRHAVRGKSFGVLLCREGQWATLAEID